MSDDILRSSEPPSIWTRSICGGCRHARPIRSGKGSTFLLCQLALVDPRFPKYPPQPLQRCPGFEPSLPSEPDAG
jgi:hypothetical protein